MAKLTVIVTEDQHALLKIAADLDGGRSVSSLLLGPALEVAREIVRRHGDGKVTAPRRQSDGTANQRQNDGTVPSPRRQNDGEGTNTLGFDLSSSEKDKPKDPPKRPRQNRPKYDGARYAFADAKIKEAEPYVGSYDGSRQGLIKIDPGDYLEFEIAFANWKALGDKRQFCRLATMVQGKNWREHLPKETASPSPPPEPGSPEWLAMRQANLRPTA